MKNKNVDVKASAFFYNLIEACIMANKKTTTKKKSSSTPSINKVIKTSKKMAKQNPKGFLIAVLVVVLLVGLGVGGYFGYKYFIEPRLANHGGNNTSQRSKYEGSATAIDINFLELGNQYTGDCTFIKAGDKDILIDAGSRQNSATTISNFIDSYCTDGVLEYVIATHAHQDHIAGFVGSNKDTGIFKKYKIDTLIDFSKSQNQTKDKPTEIYTNYINLRDEKIASGDIAHHYTAEDCVNGTNGGKKLFDLAEGIQMEILDQKYYHEIDKNDENNHSVCTLFRQKNSYYLFTGDLEAKGEQSLVETNNLPEVELFKGGHHGSYTANTDTLLSVIKPKNVCICCCAGHDEYVKASGGLPNSEHTFPAQECVDRIAKYTTKVYITSVYDESKGFKSMNGIINFHSEDGEQYAVTGSNNSTILKDTEWFKTNRVIPNEWK